MHQKITIDQLNELSDKGKKIYWNYSKEKHWIKPNSDYDLWSIGQMIEYLDENTKEYDLSIRMGRARAGFVFSVGTLITHIDGLPISSIEDEPDLCGALWEAVKEVLNK